MNNNLIPRLNNYWPAIRKSVLFGVYGAVGCLLGALIGELLLASTSNAAPHPSGSQAVCLLLDCSGSMNGAKLQEVKTAASDFVQRQAQSQNTFSVVGFGSSPHLATDLTQNLSSVQQAIDSVTDGGSTRMDAALTTAGYTLGFTPMKRNILLFTDGMPDSESEALRVALDCRSKNIRLVAIGTDDANKAFLARLTGDDALVFQTRSGQFDQAFRSAENVIYGHQLMESSSTLGQGFIKSLFRVAGWSALLAIGLTLALVAGQNKYMRRNLCNTHEIKLGTVGGIVAGISAGAAGQILFGIAGGISIISVVGRIIAWMILGALLGFGMTFFVPNLKRNRAMRGGMIGGAIGAVAFLVMAALLTDWLGRLLGAAILGFFIGLMVVLAELLAKEAWLTVRWAPGEESVVLLGRKPIILGSSSEADIYLRRDQGFPHVAAIVNMNGGRIEFEDKMKSIKTALSDGNKLVIGNITITVHAK